MYSLSKQDETTLYRMYTFSSIQAIADHPDAEGITIVQTVTGKEYFFPFDGDPVFVSQAVYALTNVEDAHIRYLIHVWKDHTLDVPSYGLRKALTELHPENGKALLMLRGENGFSILRLGDTMR